MQGGDSSEMLQMLQMLQLQLREICNNNGIRNSRSINCEGAAGEMADAQTGVAIVLYHHNSTKWNGKGDILVTLWCLMDACIGEIQGDPPDRPYGSGE
jgi:hypothetical protein